MNKEGIPAKEGKKALSREREVGLKSYERKCDV